MSLHNLSASNAVSPQSATVTAPCPAAGDRAITLLGWIATATGVLMYLSYTSQIELNLAGHKGSMVQPLATIVNCSLWLTYGLCKPVRDWPVVLANAPGVILGAITFITAF